MKWAGRVAQWVRRRLLGAGGPDVSTLIGSGTTFNGCIVFRGGLRLDGELVGSIESSDPAESVLVVGALGQVTGKVACGRIVVAGRVVGPIQAEHELELHPTARIIGEVRCRSLEVHTGGQIEGMVNVTKDLGTLRDSSVAPLAYARGETVA